MDSQDKDTCPWAIVNEAEEKFGAEVWNYPEFVDLMNQRFGDAHRLLNNGYQRSIWFEFNVNPRYWVGFNNPEFQLKRLNNPEYYQWMVTLICNLYRKQQYHYALVVKFGSRVECQLTRDTISGVTNKFEEIHQPTIIMSNGKFTSLADDNHLEQNHIYVVLDDNTL